MLLIALIACNQPEPVPELAVSLVVPLRWTAEPGGIDWIAVEAGLAWALSNLGALPPETGWLTVTESTGDTVFFEIDLDRSGFDVLAVAALEAAVAPIQDSDEMDTLGSVDVGRFLMRTLYSPWRYYSITGACADFASWSVQSQGEYQESYGVTISLLTEDERLITLNQGPWSDIGDIGFVAQSGTGVLADPSVSLEMEVIDLMRNGQQRYAVFDADGALAPAADPAVIGAGQPGKCMWCHEGSLMIGTPVNPTTRPYLSYPEWGGRISQMQTLLDEHRTELETAVDFASSQTHTSGELIVREFLHPTPTRVVREWGISEEALDELITEYGLELLLDGEYPDRGEVLSRVELDVVYAAELAATGFESLWILSDDREAPEAWETLDGEADREGLPGCWRP